MTNNLISDRFFRNSGSCYLYGDTYSFSNNPYSDPSVLTSLCKKNKTDSEQTKNSPYYLWTFSSE